MVRFSESVEVEELAPASWVPTHIGHPVYRDTQSENGEAPQLHSSQGDTGDGWIAAVTRSPGPLKSGMKKRSTYTDCSNDGGNEEKSSVFAAVAAEKRGGSIDLAVRPQSVRVSLSPSPGKGAGSSFMGAIQNLGSRVSRSRMFSSGMKSRGVQQVRAWSKGLIYKAYLARVARENGVVGKRALSEGTRPRSLKEAVNKVMESGPATVMTVVVTIFALFTDDIKRLATDAYADHHFFGTTLFCISFFTFEICMHTYGHGRKYFGGFYFYLDILATLTLLLDIEEVLMFLTGDDGEKGGSSMVQKAGKVSKVGAKVGKIVRLVRLIRILKVYREIEARARRAKRRAEAAKLKGFHDPDDEFLDDDNTKRVGDRLSDITTRKVIVGVLIIILPMPLFDITFWPEGEYPTLTDTGVHLLHEVARQCNATMALLPSSDCQAAFFRNMDTWVTYAKDSNVKVGVLNIFGQDYSSRYGYGGLDAMTKHRRDELYWAIYGDLNDVTHSYACVVKRGYAKVEAGLNMARTFFICIVLGIGSHHISRDAEHYVMRPLNHIISIVTKMSENPMLTGLRGLKDISQRIKGMIRTAATSPHLAIPDPPFVKRWLLRLSGCYQTYKENQLAKAVELQKKDNMTFETTLIESKIRKICALMAVSFGEAGSEIVATNMRKGLGLNTNVKGRKVACVFGFVRILDFELLVEALQERVTLLANAVALEVHLAAAVSAGSGNRTVGGEFRLLWRFPDEVTHEDVARCVACGGPVCGEVSVTADAALAAFARALGSIQACKSLAEFRDDPAVAAAAPGGLRLAMGLHAGWAIEGVAGSIFKADATFLSAAAELPGRVVDAAAPLGVPIVLTGDFCSLLSPGVLSMCRQIDEVRLGSPFAKPVALHTFDCDPTLLATDGYRPSPLGSPTDLHEDDEDDDDDLYFDHPDIVRMHNVDARFMDIFRFGYKNFREGNWEKAKPALQRSAILRTLTKSRDGPSDALLAFMTAHGGRPPMHWQARYQTALAPGFRNAAPSGVVSLQDLFPSHRTSNSAAARESSNAVKATPQPAELLIAFAAVADADPPRTGSGTPPTAAEGGAAGGGEASSSPAAVVVNGVGGGLVVSTTRREALVDRSVAAAAGGGDVAGSLASVLASEPSPARPT